MKKKSFKFNVECLGKVLYNHIWKHSAQQERWVDISADV